MGLITLKDISSEISARTGIRKSEVMFVLELVFPIILESLLRGDEVMITNFGKFELQKKPPHVCTDARTGKKTMSNWKAIVKFRQAERLGRKLCILTNPEYDWGEDYGDNLF